MARPLYRAYPLWVPPLDRDVRRALGRSDARAAFFLAVRGDGRVVGRVGVREPGLLDPPAGPAAAFFNWFEAEDDPVVAASLFKAAASWAHDRGLGALEGPRGANVLDSVGLLVDGFEHPPAFGVPYNPPYYEGLLAGLGFERRETWRSGYLSPEVTYDPRVDAVAQRARRDGYEVPVNRNRWDLRRWIPGLLAVYNACVAPGWPGLTSQEARDLATQMLWFADPRLVQVLLFRGAVVGFLLAYPDISAGMRAARGHVLPAGWLHLLRSRLTTRLLNVNGLAVVPEHRRTGALALLTTELLRAARAGRYESMDIVAVADGNPAMAWLDRRMPIPWTKAHSTFTMPL